MEVTADETGQLSDATALLVEVERSWPVDEWRSDGVQIWPFVRTRLGRRLFEHLRATETVSPFGSGSARLRRIRQSAGAIVRPAGRRRLGRADAVFLSDGISLSAAAGGPTFDRWCEPYERAIETAGGTPLLLVPNRCRPRARTPHLDLGGPTARRLAGAAARRRSTSVSLPGHEAMRRLLLEEIGEDLLLSVDSIKLAGRAISSLAEMHGALLTQVRPRVAFAVEYYSVQGMALMLASARAGIQSVDIQHGVQGPHHPAYGSWTNVPDRGYDLLPDTFLVWAREDADTISAWGGARHRAIVGGHPGTSLWESGAFGDPAVLIGRLRAAAGSATRCVLVPLGGDETDQEIGRVVDLVTSAPPAWQWWIRCHPLKDQRSELVALLAAQGARSADVELASSSPLPAVLAVSDVVLARFSTVVRDAARAGVPSILMDSLGRELLPEEVASGAAVLADTASEEELLSLLGRLTWEGCPEEGAIPGLEWVCQASGVAG